MTTSILTKIRSQIRPMPQSRRFVTGWRGEATFEQIAADLEPRLAWKMKRFGVYGQDLPDSIQTGIMRLWTRLIDEPDFLAEMDIYEATWKVLARSKYTTLQKQNKKYLPFTDIQGRSEMDVDEYGISGLSNARDVPTRWWRGSGRWSLATLLRSFRAAFWGAHDFRPIFARTPYDWVEKQRYLAALHNSIYAAMRS